MFRLPEGPLHVTIHKKYTTVFVDLLTRPSFLCNCFHSVFPDQDVIHTALVDCFPTSELGVRGCTWVPGGVRVLASALLPQQSADLRGLT